MNSTNILATLFAFILAMCSLKNVSSNVYEHYTSDPVKIINAREGNIQEHNLRNGGPGFASAVTQLRDNRNFANTKVSFGDFASSAEQVKEEISEDIIDTPNDLQRAIVRNATAAMSNIAFRSRRSRFHEAQCPFRGGLKPALRKVCEDSLYINPATETDSRTGYFQAHA